MQYMKNAVALLIGIGDHKTFDPSEKQNLKGSAPDKLAHSVITSAKENQ